VDQNRVDQILEGKVEVSAPYYYSILVSELHNYRHTHTHLIGCSSWTIKMVGNSTFIQRKNATQSKRTTNGSNPLLYLGVNFYN